MHILVHGHKFYSAVTPVVSVREGRTYLEERHLDYFLLFIYDCYASFLQKLYQINLCIYFDGYQYFLLTWKIAFVSRKRARNSDADFARRSKCVSKTSQTWSLCLYLSASFLNIKSPIYLQKSFSFLSLSMSEQNLTLTLKNCGPSRMWFLQMVPNPVRYFSLLFTQIRINFSLA
jgi:hypothetical protein